MSFAGLFRLLNPTIALKPDTAADSVAAGAQAISISAPIERRLTYKHSVIPGGARDDHELQRAIATDAVVADHYRGVSPGTMRAVTLTSDRVAHVSYRLGDRVYWTKRPVRIRAGETILTNGQTEIRARCGNCISLTPLLPTSEEEPDPSQLDALTDIEPLLVSWNLAPGDFPAGGPPPDVQGMLLPLLPFGLLPLGGFGGPAGTGGPIAPPAVSVPSGTRPIFDPDLPTGGTVPPFGPPSIGGFPGGGTSGGDAPNSLVLYPLVDDPGLPEPPPTGPPVLTPIPEPATLWLIAGGLGGVVLRRWRSKN